MPNRNLLPEPEATRLPDDSEQMEYMSEHGPAEAARKYPTFCGAWAKLAKAARESGDDLAAYAYARTGYHRGWISCAATVGGDTARCPGRTSRTVVSSSRCIS